MSLKMTLVQEHFISLPKASCPRRTLDKMNPRRSGAKFVARLSQCSRAD
jgi:hypothetical protein